MAFSDDTFDLVKSLTANEKRFFRLFASTQGENKNYIRVFNALDKMKSYDPKKLNQSLAGHRLNISYEKNYLQHNLLRAMRNFHADGTELKKIKYILLNIELLFQKRLLSLTQRSIDKAIAVAEKYEYRLEHLELLDWQYRLYLRTGNYKKSGAYRQDVMPIVEKLLEELAIEAEEKSIIYRIIEIDRRRGSSISGIERKELVKLHAALKKMHLKAGKSFQLAELSVSYLDMSAKILGRHKESLGYCHELLLLYKSHPHFKIERPGKYCVALIHTSERLYTLKKYDEALQLANEAEVFYKELKSLKQNEMYHELFTFASQMRIRIAIATKQYAQAANTSVEFERSWNYDNPKMAKDTRWFAKLHVARAHFFNGQFARSLKDITTFLNNVELAATQRDALEYLHLLRLLIYHDMQAFDLLESMCRNTLRLFEKNNNDEFARKLINGIKQSGNAHNDILKRRKIFSDLAKELPRMETNVGEKEDFLIWITATRDALNK